VAVAGPEAYVAATAREAWEQAQAAHPEDEGVIVQYVPLEQGPRIYANRWALVARGRWRYPAGG
jgi:hypothetical protein